MMVFVLLGKPYFWIVKGPAFTGKLHVAFAAQDQATVDAFFREAIAAGGRGNGAPSLLPQYHPHYYGAFVLAPTDTISKPSATPQNDCEETVPSREKKRAVG